MPDYKKLDDHDILISSGEITPEESKRISKYLQAYKAKEARKEKTRSLPSKRSLSSMRAKPISKAKR